MPKSTAAPAAAAPPVLANRHFLRLWSAQALTMTAQNATWYTVMVVVERSTHSGTQLSLAILSVILPAALFGLLAGVVVDHANKRMTLVVTNLLRAITLAFYSLYDVALWVLFVANFVFSSISQFFGPAEAAKIPLIVRRDQLLAANSLFNLTFSGSQLVGLVFLGPTVVKLFGADTLFLVAAAVYAVATVLVWQLPRAEPAHAPLRALASDRRFVIQSILGELREVVQTARRDAALAFALVQLTLAMGLMLVVAALAPRFVVAELGIGADDAVAVLAPAGIGVVGGALTVSTVAARVGTLALARRAVPLGGVLFAAIGAAPALLRQAPWPWLGMAAVMVLAGLLGVLFTWITVACQTLLMERTSAKVRGRVFAVQLTLGSAASILPLLFVGGLADLVGVAPVLSLIGVGLVASGLAAGTWVQRRLRAQAVGEGHRHPAEEES